MNFQELGLTLQREREARGLTIEAVMEATKISRINLVALENGDSSTLPHPVYTKGFIRSYARLLGLDADELSMVVDREYQTDDHDVETVAYDVSPAAGKAFQEGEAPAKRKKKRSVWPSILVFVALAVAGVVLVLNLNKGANTPGQDAAPATEQAAPAEEQPAPAGEQAVPAEQPAEQPVEEEAGQPVETPAVSPSEEAAPAGQAAVPEVEAAQPEAGAEEPAQAAQPEADDDAIAQGDVESEAGAGNEVNGIHYDHVLIIRATTDKGCWIGLWKGDEANMARDFVLKKGEPLRLMFNNPRRIRIGNVAGVEVTYNGAPYPLEKNKTNIQTLVFGAE